MSGFNLLEGLPERPEKGVYLDNNATTMVAPEVIESMMPFLTEFYGNPSSMHAFGAAAGRAVDQARDKMAELVNASNSSEIVFTGCGSESDNLAIVGTLRAFPEKKHIITTTVEHPAVLGQCRELESRHGYDVTYLGVDAKGMIDLDELRDSLRDDTAIVSIMSANNETGVIFPTEAIGEIVKAAGVVYHVDAVQSAGKLPLDMSTSTADLLSISGHKLHAGKGVAALYVRRGTKLRPLVVGGHQERGRRAGTESVACLVGLGVACDLARTHRETSSGTIRAMRDHLTSLILKAVPDCRLNGDAEQRLPNTANISFDYIEGEGVLLLLDRCGIAASSGSACTSGSLEPSHVLKAMGIPFIAAHGSIRFSLSRYNTMEEMDYTAQVIPRIIERLRAITPFNEERQTF
jgi:cysteine desulfurase